MKKMSKFHRKYPDSTVPYKATTCKSCPTPYHRTDARGTAEPERLIATEKKHDGMVLDWKPEVQNNTVKITALQNNNRTQPSNTSL
jgi:hypothetical protein